MKWERGRAVVDQFLAEGRLETSSGEGGRPREVRVAIQLAAPRGTAAPVALQRSARQVASTVRRALREA